MILSIQTNTFVFVKRPMCKSYHNVFITQVRLFDRLIADDAIWQPGGITHISLSTHKNFYRAFQQPVHSFQKGHASLWQFTRIPGT